MITGFVFLLVGWAAIGWAHLRGRRKAKRAVVTTSARQYERWHELHSSWLKGDEDDYPGACVYADSYLSGIKTWKADKATDIVPFNYTQVIR